MTIRLHFWKLRGTLWRPLEELGPDLGHKKQQICIKIGAISVHNNSADRVHRIWPVFGSKKVPKLRQMTKQEQKLGHPGRLKGL